VIFPDIGKRQKILLKGGAEDYFQPRDAKTSASRKTPLNTKQSRGNEVGQPAAVPSGLSIKQKNHYGQKNGE
jgi:hypothetical protein